MTETDLLMWDAANLPAVLPSGYNAAGVYIGGERATRIWTDDDVARVAQLRKLPIWVPAAAATSAEARSDIIEILNVILHYHIPRGTVIAFDLETSQADASYIAAISSYLEFFGYGTMVYGSLSTIEAVTAAPYWIWRWTASWSGVAHLDAGARATQYVSGQVDSSVITQQLYNALWPAA